MSEWKQHLWHVGKTFCVRCCSPCCNCCELLHRGPWKVLFLAFRPTLCCHVNICLIFERLDDGVSKGVGCAKILQANAAKKKQHFVPKM